MYAQTTSVPFFGPHGMDGSPVGQSPWEVLVNLSPQPSGLCNFPGSTMTAQFTATGSPRAAMLFESYNRQRMLFIGCGGSVVSPSAILVLLDDEGMLLAQYAWSGSDPLATGLYHAPFVSSAGLNGRVFFGTSIGGVWACSHKSDPDVPPYLPLDDMSMGRVSYRQGVSSANWPYVTGGFSASVFCSHLSRMFMAGFRQGELLRFNAQLTAEQAYLTPELVLQENATIVTMLPQTIVWTDPNDPFAIGLPNFKTIPSKYEIVALASMRDNLYIFTRGDVWLMSGRFEEEFTFRQIAPDLGCEGHWAVCASPGALYFANEHGIFACVGDQTVKISAAIDHLFDSGPCTALSESALGLPVHLKRKWGRMAYWPLRDELWIPVWSITAGGFVHFLVFNEKSGEWSLVARSNWGTRAGAAPLEMSLAPLPVPAGALGFSRPTSGTSSIYSYLMRPEIAYDSWLPTGEKFARRFAAISKPMFAEAGQEAYVTAASTVWRQRPDNGTDNKTGTASNYSKMLILGEDYEHDGQQDISSDWIPPTPDGAASADKTGTGKWGTAKFRSHTTTHLQRFIDTRSRYVRFAILGRSMTPVQLRGLNLFVKQVSPPGGRE